jgi:hypothetical protein
MGSATFDTSVRDGSNSADARVQCFQNAYHSSADFCGADADSHIREPRPQDKGICGLSEESHPLIIGKTLAGS